MDIKLTKQEGPDLTFSVQQDFQTTLKYSAMHKFEPYFFLVFVDW